MTEFANRRRTPLRKMARKRSSRIEAPEYLAWIRALPCLVCPSADSPCRGDVESHHVGHHGQARTNDYNAIPLCTAHHKHGFGPDAVHKIHQPAFERKFGVRFSLWIARLNRAWELKTGRPIVRRAS